jgi:hypothetical protein
MALMTARSYRRPRISAPAAENSSRPERGPGRALASRIRKDAPSGNTRRAVMSR